MMQIFNFFGSILGYLLWFLYTVFKNYGVAIILFTIILKVVLFPTTIKQQRSMASQAKLADKQKELQKKYGNNKMKYSEELQKLYDKEGVNPGSGCLTTLLPFPIMLGIYYSVIMPLSNTLHIASETVQKATDYISRIPGMVSTNTGIYSELQIIRNFDGLKDNLTMFSAQDLERITEFTKGFKFLGLDLLATPQGSAFSTFLWIIPVLAFLSYAGSQVYAMMYQKKSTGQKPQGCMIVMTAVFPIISAYWAYTMPAAVGFYWVISSITGWIQMVITNKYFSTAQMTAGAEAQRVVTLELAEGNVRPLPAETQRQIAQRLEAGQGQRQESKAGGKQQKAGPKKKKGNSGNDPSSYIASKK